MGWGVPSPYKEDAHLCPTASGISQGDKLWQCDNPRHASPFGLLWWPALCRGPTFNFPLKFMLLCGPWNYAIFCFPFHQGDHSDCCLSTNHYNNFLKYLPSPHQCVSKVLCGTVVWLSEWRTKKLSHNYLNIYSLLNYFYFFIYEGRVALQSCASFSCPGKLTSRVHTYILCL